MKTATNTPDILRRAFARVCCQIVRQWDDGSEGIINFTSRAKADEEFPKYAARIGRTFDSGVTLLDVTMRDVDGVAI